MNAILRTATACDRLRDTLATLVASGPVEVTWGPHKAKRSDQANRYLWGVVYKAFTAALPGWDAEDVHEYLLGEWAGWETLEGMGRKRLRPIRRSSRLNKAEFAEYVDFCARKGAEHGVYVPPPCEVGP